jgi:uncharacterized Tic20 family protein
MNNGEGARMEREAANYGVQREHEWWPAPRGPVGGTMSVQDERTWSVLAHLSIFLNLFTGFLGPVAALVIWLVYKDRSQKVAFHALQSMWYQVAWLVLLGVGWALTGLLTLILIGFLLIPVMAVATVVPFVHAAYAAYRVSKGDDYRYAFIADLMENR